MEVDTEIFSVLNSFDVSIKDVKVVFIDETEINVGGKKAWLWVAFEPNLKQSFLSALAGTRTHWMRIISS